MFYSGIGSAGNKSLVVGMVASSCLSQSCSRANGKPTNSILSMSQLTASINQRHRFHARPVNKSSSIARRKTFLINTVQMIGLEPGTLLKSSDTTSYPKLYNGLDHLMNILFVQLCESARPSSLVYNILTVPTPTNNPLATNASPISGRLKLNSVTAALWAVGLVDIVGVGFPRKCAISAAIILCIP